MWAYGYTQFRRDECVSLGLDRKILLTEDQIPKNWYCILPDLPAPLKPLLDPKTQEPVDPKTLEAIFPKELNRQEVSGNRFVQIPKLIRNVYHLWRLKPTYSVHARIRIFRTVRISPPSRGAS